MSDPVLDALNAAAAQPAADPVLAALTARAGASTPAVTPAAAQAPAADRGLMGQARDFVAAAGHHLANLPHGLAQTIEHATIEPAMDVHQWLIGHGLDNPVSRWALQAGQGILRQDDAATNQREADYQAGVPNSAGAYAGATVGEVLPFLSGSGPLSKGPALARALSAGGDAVGDAAARALPAKVAPLAAKVVSAATQGAMVSAAQPVTAPPPTMADMVTGAAAPAPDFDTAKRQQIALGAALGGAVPAVVAPLGAAVRGVRSAAAPILHPEEVAAPALRQVVLGDGQGADLPSVLEALRGAPELVPGSRPTTAQVLARPDVVMAEKTVANTPAGKVLFDARANDNNAARLASLQQVAGTDEALQAAIGARRANAQPMIERLQGGELVPIDHAQGSGAVADYLARLQSPRAGLVDVQPVLEQLQALQNSSLGTDPVVSKATGDLLAQIRGGVTRTGAGGSLIRPDLLDGYRQNVRAFLEQHASNGAVASRQEAAFEPVRSAIVDSIERANPGYRDYLAQYAKDSAPINAMEAGRRLLADVAGGGRGANSAGDPQVTLAGYRAALARALGGPFELEPGTRAKLEAIQADLQRASISNSIRAAGSDTALNLQAPGWLAGKLYGPDMSGGGKGAVALAGALGLGAGFLHGGPIGAVVDAGVGATGAKKLGELGGQRVREALARALLDPAVAADMLEAEAARSGAAPRLPGALSALPPQLSSLLLARELQNTQNVRP